MPRRLVMLLVLDYIQRIPPPGNHADKRVAVNATMDYLRQFSDAAVAVLVLAVGVPHPEEVFEDQPQVRRAA